MAGIKDVAKKAGVGIGTVSRVINSTGYVSEETRKKVQLAMEELNYVPNQLARNLSSKRTGIVAILIPELLHPFFASFVHYAEIGLAARGYKTMVCSTANNPDSEFEYLKMLQSHMVDGIIVGVHTLDVHQYLDVEGPIVALDRYIGEKIPIVSANHRKGGRMAAEELYRSGARNIIQFSAAESVQSPAKERHREFEKFFSEKGIKIHNVLIEWNELEIPYFKEIIEPTFDEIPDADGVFGTDLVVMTYMKCALERGKKIPQDIRLVSYDGTFPTELATPGLTMIRQPIQKLAETAAHFIVRKIEGKDYHNKFEEIDVELHIDASTRG